MTSLYCNRSWKTSILYQDIKISKIWDIACLIPRYWYIDILLSCGCMFEPSILQRCENHLTSTPPDFTTVDITQHARQVVQIVELAASMDEKLTPLKLVDTWMGKGPAKRRKMIQTTTLSRLQAEAVIVRMLLQDYLGWLVMFCCCIHSVIHGFKSCFQLEVAWRCISFFWLCPVFAITLCILGG